MSKNSIIFTYNADSGFVNLMKDVVHRVASPGTYPCNLCKVTYGPTGMKNDWKKFIDSIDADVEFLHADEFAARFPDIKIQHPSVVDGSTKKVILNAADMNSPKTVTEFIDIVRAAL